MSVATLDQKNAKVLHIEDRLRAKLGGVVSVILQALGKVDPNGLLIFEQAHEIDRLQVRCATLGLVLAQAEEARDAALREFSRLQAKGVDVNPTTVEVLRGCLAEAPQGEGDDDGR